MSRRIFIYNGVFLWVLVGRRQCRYSWSTLVTFDSSVNSIQLATQECVNFLCHQLNRAVASSMFYDIFSVLDFRMPLQGIIFFILVFSLWDRKRKRMKSKAKIKSKKKWKSCGTQKIGFQYEPNKNGGKRFRISKFERLKKKSHFYIYTHQQLKVSCFFFIHEINPLVWLWSAPIFLFLI